MDIEQILDERLKSGEFRSIEVRLLLERCRDYRERLHTARHNWDRQLAPLMSELAVLRNMHQETQRCLNFDEVFPQKDTWYSLRELLDRVGRIAAYRLVYGGEFSEETLEDLRKDVREAKKQSKRWVDLICKAGRCSDPECPHCK